MSAADWKRVALTGTGRKSHSLGGSKAGPGRSVVCFRRFSSSVRPVRRKPEFVGTEF